MLSHTITQMKRRRQTGNVVILAITISIFLFFLSTALIAQNSQNINLVLCEDHRARAQNCANAGLDYALSVMRNHANWRELLVGRQGEMESGGTWKIENIQYSTYSDHVLEITAAGTSGVFTVRKSRVVEEVSAADVQSGEVPAGQAPTHLFAYALVNGAPKLAALLPDMRWHILGDPANKECSWLAAYEGPLFTQTAMEKRVFTIPDYNDSGEATEFEISADTYPVAFLEAKGSPPTYSWSDPKIPCYFIPPSANGNNVKLGDSGKESLSQYIPAKEEPEDVPTKHTGPQVEYYVNKGAAIAASGTKIYCHGVHHYFQGSVGTYQKDETIKITKPAKEYTAPAILCYDSQNNTWSVAHDTMKVDIEKVTEAPERTELEDWQKPCTDTLAVVDGYLVCLSNADKKTVLVASGMTWKRYAQITGDSWGIYNYDNRILSHRQVSIPGETRTGLIGFSDDASLVKDVFIKREKSVIASGSGGNIDFLPQLKFFPSVDVRSVEKPYKYFGNNSVACCGKHIYTFCNLSASSGEVSSALKTYSNELYEKAQNTHGSLNGKSLIGIIHYDGNDERATWQMWPNGVYYVANNFKQCCDESTLMTFSTDNQGETAVIQPYNLAAAYYKDVALSVINRYSVLTDTEVK